MSDKVYSGKTLSFLELLNDYNIEIPIIQRDYAQGRKDKKEIRQNFLNAIKEALVNEIPIKLDFIYGSNTTNSFQPLDGQQRLTTLFLLYWYAANRCSENNNTIRPKLLKFSYETRISSREFCQALINDSISIADDVEPLSEKIIDSNWFFLSWKKDPTIDSMLRTIDDIHRLFFGITNLYELLSNKNLISFYFVELEHIGLTDDLYIKMNARGKLLTAFENFKASLQKYVNDNKWEKDKSPLELFSFKIDSSWTDFFWSKFRKDNSIDDAYMRFIASIAMVRVTLERSKYRAEDRNPIVTKLQEAPDFVKPKFFSKEGFDYLFECFEIYNDLENKCIDLSLDFPLWRHQPKNSILSDIVYEEGASSIASASYSLKVLFYAQTEYLRRVDSFDRTYFLDWMRVVRNIISRGDIDKEGKRPDIIRSPQTFDGVINLINELAEGCQDIYNHLSSITSLKSTFAKEQIEEEKIKSKLIVEKPDLKKLIISCEDNELLRGRIDFIFYCIEYTNGSDEINEKMLEKVGNVFATYFNKEMEISGDLRRAILTIEVNGDFDFYNYWWSFWNVISATKRRLFDKYRELEYFIYSEQREYFKKLILQLCNKDLKTIVKDFDPPSTMPNWKVRLIKEPKLLDEISKSNYIAIPDDNACCYLLKSKRPRDMEGCEKVE